jgi:UV excision repair protein RAD23
VVTTPAVNPPVENSEFITPEALQGLIGMGFPEEDSKAALTAAMGNPDLAYEFLLGGIPQNAPVYRTTRNNNNTAVAAPTTATTTATAAAATGVDQLRSHPQFNMLKQLIQQNPASLPQVLDLIGQQNPALLQAIHADETAFINLMNEPIVENPTLQQPPAQQFLPPNQQQQQPDPNQVLQMLTNMPPAQRAAFAPSLGLSAEQFEGFMSMMAQLPQGELQNMLAAGGLGGVGAGVGGGARQDGPGVIRLSEEEMQAVNRLVALGFSQQQAAQAYLACDKNEALAANLLFEGGWGDDDGGDFGANDHDDDMYH